MVNIAAQVKCLKASLGMGWTDLDVVHFCSVVLKVLWGGNLTVCSYSSLHT